MKVLYRERFRVPKPIAWSRHTVVMEFVDAFPLRMIESVPDELVGGLYAELMDMVVQLAKRGLIHGDFNEFNILIKEEEEHPIDSASPSSSTGIILKPVLIDFPQTISTNHVNAQMYFDRDVGCVKRYFERRFKYTSDEPGPFFSDAVEGIDPETRLDVEVEASGFSKKMARDLESYVEVVGGDEGEGRDGDGEDDEDEKTEELDDDAEAIPEDPQVDDPKLVEQLGSLSLRNEDYAVRPVRPADYGLMPLDLPDDRDVVAEKIHAKKKAAGWAI